MFVLTSVCVSVQVIKLERAIKVEGVVLKWIKEGCIFNEAISVTMVLSLLCWECAVCYVHMCLCRKKKVLGKFF